MSEFLFMIKCFVLAVVVVYLMQLKVGEQSLDDHMMDFAQRSALAGFLSDTSEGGARLVHKNYVRVKTWAQRQFSSMTQTEPKIRALPERVFRGEREDDEDETLPQVSGDRRKQKRYLDQPSTAEALEY